MRHVYKPGDEVFTQYHRNPHAGPFTVDRVLKTTIVLSNGTRWSLDGCQKPRGDGFMWSSLRSSTPELRRAVHVERARERLASVKWDAVPQEIVLRVYDFYRRLDEEKTS